MTFLEGLQERYESAKSSCKNLHDRLIKENEYVAAAIGLGATIVNHIALGAQKNCFKAS
jgi:hypothetical protein